MSYKKPQAEKINTAEICEYGCGTQAQYKFWNGKLCCSKHHNSCKGKREAFSKLDHTERTSKSLATRIEKGITKTSQIKATATRKANNHYEKNLGVIPNPKKSTVKTSAVRASTRPKT